MTTDLRLPFDDEPGAPALGDVELDAADQRARAFASDPLRHVALEASAGTGKTRVLVDRYLRLVGAGVPPASIVAITFTRKAAAEMRQRIVQDARAGTARSSAEQARWRDLGRRLGDIAIGTIDAFCLGLLREFPLEADLDPAFAMADETEVLRLVEEALDRTLRIGRRLAREDPDVALLFAELGETRVRLGLATLIARRLVDPALLRRFIMAGPRELTAEEACRRASDRLRDTIAGVPGGLEAFLRDGPVDHRRYALLVRDIRSLCRSGRSVDADDIPKLRAQLDHIDRYFLTDERGPRHKLASAYRPHHASSPGAWARHRAGVVGLAPGVAEVLAAFRRDLSFVLARGLWRLLQIALDEYRRTLDAHTVLDFPEVLKRAVDLVQRMDEFARSRYCLESRYHHLLVDEFQDTSRAQWTLVSLLIQSWGEGAGLVQDAPLPPSIFIVGDRKQSIYGFRDAEVAVLEEASRRIEELRPGEDVRRSIAHNFRSVQALLAFNNDLFAAVEKAEGREDAFRYDDTDRFPLGTAPEKTRGDALGLIVGDGLTACAEAVAREIERLLVDGRVRDKETGMARPVGAGDIAVLFRSRDSHREFQRAFEARQIPAYVYKGLGFFDADEIKDAVALLRYLADPASDLRAAAFLRSRFVRLSDGALSTLGPRVASALTGLPAIQATLDEEDARVLTLLCESLPRWLSLVDRVPPADLLDQVLAESAYAFEIRGPRRLQAQENLKKIRGLVRKLQNRGYATLERIARHLDRLSTGDESNAIVDAVDAVNLMTVHAAKGLEFPVVFLVHLAKGTGGVSPPIRVARDDVGEPSVSVRTLGSDADQHLRAREREQTKRLLYVAMTRARDRLYLSAVLKKGALKPIPGSLAEVLPPAVQEIFSAAGRVPDAEIVAWVGPSGMRHVFRVYGVTKLPPKPGLRGKVDTLVHNQAVQARLATIDDFDPLVDGAATIRMAVTDFLAGIERPAQPVRLLDAPADAFGEAAARLIGTLVHRLFQSCAGGPTGALEEDACRRRARALLRADEIGRVEDVPALVEQAVETYRAMRVRENVASVLAAGDCLYEVPFSMKVDADAAIGSRFRSAVQGLAPAPWPSAEDDPRVAPPVIVRGVIDCLVRHPDGRITVLELKTGVPKPEHRAQLDLYVAAARAVSRGAEVEGLLVYPDEASPAAEQAR